MKPRATLTIDPDLHAHAKRLARRRGTTVSGLFESFLRSQPAGEPSVVDAMIGGASLKQDAAGADPCRDRLRAKYVR